MNYQFDFFFVVAVPAWGTDSLLLVGQICLFMCLYDYAYACLLGSERRGQRKGGRKKERKEGY